MTRAEVTDIKTLLASGAITMADIARRHGVDRAVIYRMRDGKTWGHDLSSRTPWHKLTPEQRAEMKHRYETQLIPQKDLAREYGISQSHVSRIVNGAIKDTAEY